MMKQTRLEMQKALEQDASVYEYDSVYEELQKKKEESSAKGLAGVDKKPKYIASLLRAVEVRKKEQDRRNERKIQLEREAEGEQFQDKEAFVTSAYRAKLLETKKEEESERREGGIEAALDVKKQKDLSGFYRHLLNQTVGEEKLPDREKRGDPQLNEARECQSLHGHNTQDNQDKDADCEIDSEGEEEQGEKTRGGSSEASRAGAGAGSSGHSKRQYRQRSPSSESEEEMVKKENEGQREKKHRKDRDREREDRHSRSRREEKKRDRGERDRDREDRHRGKEERDRRKEKDSRRAASPKEKVKVEEGERVKEKEERGSPAEKHSRGGSSSSSTVPGGGSKEAPEPGVNKFAKRSSEETVLSARDRYLARQMSRSAAKTYIEKEED
ncbi:NSRP1 protein, partial [Polyodon spathula]|nr:NSRP1 protein [Polyodon spathula]